MMIEIKISDDLKKDSRKTMKAGIISGPLVKTIDRMNRNALRREIQNTKTLLRHATKGKNGSTPL